MTLLVQKFGGTSVGDVNRIQAVAKKIASCKEAGNDIVVVVSAMGDNTDQLTKMAFEISKNPITHQLNFYSIEDKKFKKIF